MANVRRTSSWKIVAQAFEEELCRRGRAKSTVKGYVRFARDFGIFYKKELGKKRLAASRIQETDLYAYVDHLRSTRLLSISTVNSAVAALRSLASFLVGEGAHSRDVARELRSFRQPPPSVPEHLSAAEAKRLVASVDVHGRQGRRNLVIVQLMLQCGLRVGEVAQLSIRDVDLHKTSGKVRVRDRKNRSERVMPLNRSLRTALRNFLPLRRGAEGSEPLFLSERKKRISVKMLEHMIKKHLVAIGRGDLSAHDLRHAFALSVYDKTGKLTVVQSALGHRSIATTARYARTTPEELANAVEELDANIFHDEVRSSPPK